MATVTLPPGPSAPRFVQGAYAMRRPRRGVPRMRERYGGAFTVNVPIFGHTVVISDPAEIRQLFQTSAELADNLDRNLGRILGPHSLFALSGDEHRQRRKLLVPPFHGRRLAAYEAVIEQETVRELASWPQGREFPVLPSTMRITLNVILRAVFGADGAELAELRALLPRLVKAGAPLAVVSVPRVDWGRWSPWGRYWIVRRAYDAVVDRLITAAENDPDLGDRDDILAMMVQSRYDDGSPMSRDEIADHLLTLLVAGHETTATTLAWAVERIRRHPEVLRELLAEVDAGGSAYREATIAEVQRVRPVIEFVGRQVKAGTLQLGRWTVPKGYAVIASIALIHDDASLFPNPRTFDPGRFVGAKPDLYQWIPFGGGTRRCLGAAFANTEMHVVLRTLLRDFTVEPTTERGERWYLRGVANAPARGGRLVVRRRSSAPAPAAVTASDGEGGS